MSIRVEGGDELGTLAAALRSASRAELMQGLAQELHQAAEPMPEAVRRAARDMLPESGGFAELVADSRIGVVVHRSASQVIVTVAAVNGMDLPRIDRGRLRHPRFGHRGEGDWFTQAVPPGFFTRTLLARAPAVREAAERAVQRLADKIN